MSSDLRFERKFVVEGPDFGSIEGIVRRHPAGFGTVHPPRRINSIYFDTPSFDRYHENAAGLSRRSKVRLRWYGRFFGTAPSPRLEIKGRTATVGSKHRLAAPPIEVSRRLSGRALAARLAADGEPELRNQLLGILPVVATSYRRRYWLSRDRRYRLTLDTDLTYYRIHPTGIEMATSRADLDLRVLELKYGRADDFEVDRIVQHLPWRLGRNSKYARAVELLYRVSP